MLLGELDSAPSDTEIIKKRYSAFFGTKLYEYLQGKNIRSIVVVGVNTHACVRMTAIDAYQHDYPVYVISDCVGSYDPEHHEVTLSYGMPAFKLRGKTIAGFAAFKSHLSYHHLASCVAVSKQRRMRQHPRCIRCILPATIFAFSPSDISLGS